MRRKRRFSWLPTLGSRSELGQAANFQPFRVQVQPGSGPSMLNQWASQTAFAVFPLTLDKPLEAGEVEIAEGDAAGRLQAIVGQEWFCERIVGHFFVSYDLPDTGQRVPPAVLVTLGFFVARAGDAAGLQGAGLPIGFSGAETFRSYSPVSQNAIREPWMFRRSWMLGGAVQPGEGFSALPTSNVFYGDALSGPKIDVKSVRRIGNDDRLWAACTTTSFGEAGGAGEITVGNISCLLDLRVLGALRRAKPTGKF